MKKEYKEAFAEVDEILNLMPIYLLNKIPSRFKEFVKSEKSKKFFPNIKEPIENCELREETIIILALIYRDFLCNENEKKRVKRKRCRRIKKNRERNKGEIQSRRYF